MIETLIEAERALTHGLIDQAERLYQVVVDTDPKSSIAVMGLARVALERGDDRTAYLHGRAALEIDPENPAAQHLVMRLAEVMTGRGETVPEVAKTPHNAAKERATAQPGPGVTPVPSARQDPTPSPGLLGRLLRRKPRRR
jgi:uncharacterized protein HemY